MLLGKYTQQGHDTEGSASKSDAGFLAHSFIAGRVAAAAGTKVVEWTDDDRDRDTCLLIAA
jgi:hypothetical protein